MRAHDEEERRALRRFARWVAVLVVVASGGMGLALALGHVRVVLLIGAGHVVVSGALAGVWLPRLQRRRIEAEDHADPGSAARRRMKRLMGWTACALLVGSLILAAFLT